MDNNWIYNYQSVSGSAQLPENTLGFIYRITNLVDNRIYIGKKTLDKANTWLKYWSSSTDLKADIKKYGISDKESGVTRFTREIIETCNTKIDLTYQEERHQMIHNVLTTNSYNKCIGNRYFKGKLATKSLVACPYCNTLGVELPMQITHFDNCKFKHLKK
jgi:ubiquinone biosynthesis protein Coq4